MVKTQIVKIGDLIFDEDLYPRMKVGWLTAYQYAQAMKAGSVFPPILVGKYEGKLYVVDGWHRVEAKKILGEEFIQATIKEYTSEKDIFLDAIKANVAHGRPLSVQEKVRLINKLEEMNFTREQISEIVFVPADMVEKLRVRTIIGPNGKPIYLKSVVAKSVTDSTEASEVDMDKFSVRTVKDLLSQMIALLEAGIYPLEDEDVKELTVKLYTLLGERLKLVEVR